MSDLISRSELLNAFNNKNIQITFDLPVEEVLGEDVDLDDFAMLVQDAIQSYKKMVIDTIKEQSTAYDIDKVVEELEERKALHERLVDYETKNGTVTEKYQHIKAIDVLNDAIEIVKQGGVADDVCEWKQTSTARYKTGCGYKLEEYFDTNACYCKQCGKKIKVVDR